jgi:hypothetical protein
MKDYLGTGYLFYANPKTYPDWKWAERFAICMNITDSTYINKPVWRWKVKDGTYKDYIFEIDREIGLQVVVRNAIPKSILHDLMPISPMRAIEPKKQ